jgi:hypothetical protein
VDRKPPLRGSVERGAAPQHQAATANDFAVLERSYDWLPHFDDTKVICRSHRISVLRSGE